MGSIVARKHHPELTNHHSLCLSSCNLRETVNKDISKSKIYLNFSP